MSATHGVEQVAAVILAGGLGTRLRAVVRAQPKVLAPVRGKPFLAYLLDQLCGAGIRTAVICSGYLGEQIEAAFGSAYGPVRVEYSREAAPLGTGGALRAAAPLLGDHPVLVLNGDSYCELDPRALWAWHAAKGAAASIACRGPASVVHRERGRAPGRLGQRRSILR
ncbi:MAG: sugar phosphate nucleotidyltransferase [Planctomycetota bacterium]|nr:sugar phosphate nucleotidyltransferase [Planctomycetota bacterium]